MFFLGRRKETVLNVSFNVGRGILKGSMQLRSAVEMYCRKTVVHWRCLCAECDIQSKTSMRGEYETSAFHFAAIFWIRHRARGLRLKNKICAFYTSVHEVDVLFTSKGSRGERTHQASMVKPSPFSNFSLITTRSALKFS